MKVLHSRILKRFPGLRHGTATLAYQPLTFHGHKSAVVAAVRERFLRSLDIPLAELTLARQVHGSHIHIVSDAEQGSGAKNSATYLPAADALLTQWPNLALGVFTADCVPLLLHDPVTGWIGSVHAGWKGVVRGIVPKTLATLQAHGVRMQDLRAWIGPCICARCFTSADPQWAKQFFGFGNGVVTRKKNVYHINIRAAVQQQLRLAGVRKQAIATEGTCTKTNRWLASVRRDGKTDKHNLTVIARHAAPHDLRGKRVVVFGLGTLGGGVASVRFAAAQHAQVQVVDAQSAAALRPSRVALKGLPVTYHFGWPEKKMLPPADLIVANPGVRPRHPALVAARKAGARVTSDLALYRASSTNPIIAVTGTKGKTTVANWIAHLLAKQQPILAGNLQRSPLEIPKARDGKTPVVLEVSSFQLEHCDVPLQPRLSILTNLYADHLNRHGTMRAYAKVKAQLFAGTPGPVILPLDSAWRTFAPKLTLPKVYWTSDRPQRAAHAWLAAGWIMLRVGQRAVRLLQTKHLRGHDVAMLRNAVTVALAGKVLGLSLADIRKGLRSFRGVPQRFEVIRKLKGRTFINSTTATNPVAAIAALQSVPGRCILIAGGASKHLPMHAFAQAIRLRQALPIFLAGSATGQLLAALHAKHPVVQSMQAAVALAWRSSKPGDTILLAPGAASFGMFRNEFDRGAQFTRAVQKLR